MIGNDIVDLHHAAVTSNWKRPRFLNKVFTPAEQLIITNSSNKHKTIWLLWSMKEAAYKIHVRQFGKRFFNPKRLVCELNSKNSGIVRIANECYNTKSTITESYIYTIASLSKFDTIKSAYFKVKSTTNNLQSEYCRSKALQAYSALKNLELSGLSVKKDSLNIPQFFFNNIKQTALLSMTHHGQYYAYTIL